MFVVAGVTGHVGSQVATQLLAKGQKIKVLVRTAAKGAAWSAKGAEVAEGTFEDRAFLAAALKGAAGAFLLLPPNFQVPDVYAYYRAIVGSIAGAVKDSGLPHAVMLSSVGADVGEGNGPIKGANWLENALRETGVKLSAIRAGSFQENVAMALAPAKMGIYPSFSPADDALPMIATKDIATQVVASLLTPPAKSEVVDLHGPAYSPRQVAEKLGKKLGKTLQVVEIPPAGYVDALMKGGMPKAIAEMFAEMYQGFGSGKLSPKGDRLAEGKTPIDEVIAALG